MPDPVEPIRLGSARRVAKRPLPVTVRFASAPTRVPTLEGPVDCEVGDAILTGPAGEQWPVERARFDTRYRPDAGTSGGRAGVYRPVPVSAWAVRTPVDVEVPLAGDQGVLHAQAGDWILHDEDGSRWVVAADVFGATYAELAVQRHDDGGHMPVVVRIEVADTIDLDRFTRTPRPDIAPIVGVLQALRERYLVHTPLHLVSSAPLHVFRALGDAGAAALAECLGTEVGVAAGRKLPAHLDVLLTGDATGSTRWQIDFLDGDGLTRPLAKADDAARAPWLEIDAYNASTRAADTSSGPGRWLHAADQHAGACQAALTRKQWRGFSVTVLLILTLGTLAAWWRLAPLQSLCPVAVVAMLQMFERQRRSRLLREFAAYRLLAETLRVAIALEPRPALAAALLPMMLRICVRPVERLAAMAALSCFHVQEEDARARRHPAAPPSAWNLWVAGQRSYFQAASVREQARARFGKRFFNATYLVVALLALVLAGLAEWDPAIVRTGGFIAGLASTTVLGSSALALMSLVRERKAFEQSIDYGFMADLFARIHASAQAGGESPLDAAGVVEALQEHARWAIRMGGHFR